MERESEQRVQKYRLFCVPMAYSVDIYSLAN